MNEMTPHELLGLLHRVAKKGHPKPPQSTEGLNEGENFRGKGRILTTLSREDGLSQRTLAERLDIRPQSLSETVVKLAEEGYIRRVASENDKRELLLFITDRGRVRASEIRARREAFASELFSVLSDGERRELENILKKLEAKTKEECI